MQTHTKIATWVASSFLAVVLLVIVYQIFIKKTPVDVNEGLENRIIVESLTLPQVFTPQQNARIVTELAPRKTSTDSGGLADQAEAKRNADIVNSLVQ